MEPDAAVLNEPDRRVVPATSREAVANLPTPQLVEKRPVPVTSKVADVLVPPIPTAPPCL